MKTGISIQEAKSVSIVDFLARLGYSPARVSQGNVWYLSPLHPKRTPSFKVAIDLNLWYDHGLGIGGSIIDLVMRLNSLKSVAEALVAIVESGAVPCASTLPQAHCDSPYQEVRESPLRKWPLIAYLDSRGIEMDVARRECVKLDYALRGKSCYAIGFKNQSGGYEIRNPQFKGSISPKDITVRAHKKKGKVAVFEGFFDYLTFLQRWGAGSDAVILNSTANLIRARAVLESYAEAHLFLDNDEGGERATAEITSWLGDRATSHNSLYRSHNDLNEWHVKARDANKGTAVDSCTLQ
ncbi:MAG: toprim domain-containing protein [Bacteroidales bacterium]|nr:toprim domain-containing protein [Bacteroidales bacterium]